MASAGRLSAKIKKNVNGFALQPGLFLGARQGTGWPQAKIKKNVNGFCIYTVKFPLGWADWASRGRRPRWLE